MTDRLESSPARLAGRLTRRFAGRALLGALALIGAVWVGRLFLTALEDLDEPMPPLSFTLVGATVCLCGTSVASALAYWTLLRGDGCTPDRRPALRAFFVAQLLRYLPGRIWGIVYQVASTRPNTRSAIIRANVDFMLVATLVNASICTALAGTSLGWSAIVTWGVPFVSASVFGLRLVPSVARVAPLLLLRLAPGIAGRTGVLTLAPRSPVTMATAGACMFLALVSYAFAWTGLGAAHPAFTDVPMLQLGALYALSSIVGMLAFVSPGGIGVREGSFVALGLGTASPEVLALLAVLFRVATFGCEALVACIAIVAFRTRRPGAVAVTKKPCPEAIRHE